MAVSSTFAVLALLLWVPSALGTGTMETCVGHHVFAVTETTNATTVTYVNTFTSEISTISLNNVSLPSLAVCGRGYQRCNLLLTSNHDNSIVLAMFAVNSGIGLVSYYNTTSNGTLVYRDQHVLTSTTNSCTFLYFVQFLRNIRGYCLQISTTTTLYSHIVSIDHDNLTLSSIASETSRTTILHPVDLESLSNFVFFSDRDRCFSNENGHVLFLESGYVVDHSFADRDFDDLVDSGCLEVSRLYRAGEGCMLVIECNGSVVLINTRDPIPRVLSGQAFGQVFVCPNDNFVAFKNGTLSLYVTSSNRSINTSTPFPFEGTILQGDCLVEKEQLILVATLDDGRSILVDFVTPYRQLGESNHLLPIPLEVLGDIGIVGNSNNTLIYDFDCSMCDEEPTAFSDNFVLVNQMSMSPTNVRQCPFKLSSTAGSGNSSQPVPSHTSPTLSYTSPLHSSQHPVSSPSPSPVSMSNDVTVLTILIVSVCVLVVLNAAIIVILLGVIIYKRKGKQKKTVEHITKRKDILIEENSPEVIPLKDNIQSINKTSQLVNRCESKSLSHQEQESQDYGSDSSKIPILLEQNNHHVRVEVHLSPSSSESSLDNGGQNLTKEQLLQQNLDNNYPNCQPTSFGASACAPPYPAALPQDSNLISVHGASMLKSASEVLMSQANDYHNDTCSIVRSKEESGYNSSTSQMLPGFMLNTHVPSSNGLRLSTPSASTPTNISTLDRNNCTLAGTHEPVQVSDGLSCNVHAALVHDPPSLNGTPRLDRDTVVRRYQQRKERENQGDFRDIVDAVREGGEPNNNNYDTHRRFSSSSAEGNSMPAVGVNLHAMCSFSSSTEENYS